MIITVTLNPALDKTAEVDVMRSGALNRLRNITLDAGGKGINVSMVINALGGSSIAAGFAGGATGEEVLRQLEMRGIQHEFVRIRSATRINLKIIDANASLTELNEPGPEVSAEEWRQLERILCSFVSKNAIFVLSGSLPRNLAADTYLSLCRVLRNADARVFVDADGEAFRWAMEAPPDYIKPNRYELLQYFGADENATEADMLVMCRKLLDRGVRLLALSLGEEGAIFVSREGAWRAPALPVTARSTVGAGDSMVAAIVYGIEQKMPVEECITLAMAVSAGAVTTEGTKPPSLFLVEEFKRKVVLHKL
jgi:1-phosphofructokinase